MKWLNRFLIFLLIILVAISVGLSIYYFMRNNEIFSFSAEDGQSITKYVNVGETFDITVTRKNPSKDEYSLKSLDENIVKFVEKVDENVFRFSAENGGKTSIQLITTNKAYKNLNVVVYVGNGSEENPFFIRNYDDLSSIGTGAIVGRTLEANYQQVADIDMNVATTAWSPIGLNSTTGFNGKYNGNGHTISNMQIIASGAEYAYEGAKFVEGGVENAGLFAVLGKNAVVSHLKLTNATINCDFVNAGVVAGVNYGKINFVTVTNSIVANSNNEATTTFIGGIAGKVVAKNVTEQEFTARVQYSSVANTKLQAKNSGSKIIGGIVGRVDGGMIYNTFAMADIIAVNGNQATLGGLVGSVANDHTNAGSRVAIVNNYAKVLSFDVRDVTSGSIGLLLGENLNEGTDTTPELKPLEENKWQNRILGNFVEKENLAEGATATPTIGGVHDEDISNAYLALAVSAENLKVIPTNEQLEQLNTSGAINPDLAFVGYDSQGFYAIWDFTSVWNIEPSVNNGYAFIRDDAVTVSDIIYDEFGTRRVDNEAKLRQAFADDFADDGLYNGKYLITNDITLTGEWTPIGTSANPFNGKFVMGLDDEGNTVSINNLLITGNYSESGFFGCIGTEGTVEGLNLYGVKIENAKDYAGAIAGINNGTIANCTVKANVENEYTGLNIKKTNDYNLFVGGIAGYVGAGAQVLDCEASLNVIADNTIATSESTTVIYVGGIAGCVANGEIINCAYTAIKNDFGYAYEIKAMSNLNANMNVGGIAGAVMSASRIDGCTFSGSAVASNVENTVAGGIAGMVELGYNAERFITKSTTTNSKVTGYIAGGIVGRVECATKDFVAVSMCASNGEVFGTRVGGLAGVLKKGVITNSMADCSLSGRVMGGLSAEIAYDNGDSYGRVSYCFSNCSFVTSAGSAYCETESEVRATKFWIIDKTKLGGYVEHCIYNKDRANGAERRLAYDTWAPWGNDPDDGRTSDNDCKKMNAFKNRGFDMTIWSFGTDENPRYPTLKIATNA